MLTINTLKEVQVILTFATVAKNSDWSINMATYENIFFHYFERCREIYNAQGKTNIFWFFILLGRSRTMKRLFEIRY